MDWHARFLQQAEWTRDLRAHLFGRARLDRAKSVLEVGCGTGAILGDLPTPASVHGLDLEPARLVEARIHAPTAYLTCSDALHLPYPARRSTSLSVTFSCSGCETRCRHCWK